jgi:hypothetical protein
MRTKKDEGWGKYYRVTAKALGRVNLNCYEGRILRAIEYKTICFNKVSDIIPESQFLELTGIATWNQQRPINGLLKKGVIWCKGNEYGLCKEFLVFEATSNQKELKEATSNQKKSTSNQNKSYIQSDVLIRASHKNIHKKVLSNHQDKDQIEENKKNVSVILKNLANMKGMK